MNCQIEARYVEISNLSTLEVTQFRPRSSDSLTIFRSSTPDLDRPTVSAARRQRERQPARSPARVDVETAAPGRAVALRGADQAHGAASDRHVPHHIAQGIRSPTYLVYFAVFSFKF